MKIKRVIGLQRVVRMAVLGFLPADDLADVFNQHFAFSNVLHGKNTFAVDAGAANLDSAASAGARGGAGHGKTLLT
jgi:hypothetical protein